MGFFSWNCRECGQSILNVHAITPKTKWRNEMVAVLKNGSVLFGPYDGYGRVGDIEIPDSYETPPDVYHVRCYGKAGTPNQYKGGSEHAEDQGYFKVAEKRRIVKALLGEQESK